MDLTTRVPPPAREWTQAAADGTQLFVRCLEAQGPARGTVLIVHGFGEHSGRYIHVMERLGRAGLRVVAADLRGHGRSEGKRGDIPSYETFLDDLLGIWRSVRELEPGPAFLYGHSLGGQIALNLAAAHRLEAAGLVITSPWLKLAFVPPLWQRTVAWAAAHFWPGLTQTAAVRPERLSRDLAFLSRMPDLHLVHHRMSARMYHLFLAGAERARREGPRLTDPILLLHGSDDPVTSAAATEELFARMKATDKTLLVVPGALHETHNDLGREEVTDQIATWILQRCGTPAARS